ncbi:indole-3-glycerol phosphate synthase TrpC [Bacteroides clarus]|uniref:indole-3-glycerol-phosphate synthase n=1 Tax=Bacteroides clarus TaxID=626929 RepID=A0A412Y803_9BACE|nr:indole-3-glycerol phosphate synthase TrpC [Bacteroides clarus]RGV36550.1 indole-3-glycerol-phosphate synthase [Bacteroides clarus]RGV53545.1 indole-3-glycerol-phosphate synthase [Bacteroides clarus]
MDILSEITDHKRIEVELQKQAVSPEQLREQVRDLMENSPAPRRSMKRALASSPAGIIAEFKRRSPSKGWIYETAKADEIPAAYEAAGASAISILTDEKFFGGSLRDIRTARPLVDIPILRKDFIIDEYQLLQARIAGADAVLLIAACLTQEECADLTARAHALGLEVLLEIHSPRELAYISKDVDMVGVNNRNLGTFVTDVENSFRIAGQLRQTIAGVRNISDARNVPNAQGSSDTPRHLPLLVSESGISHPETICRLRTAGFRGFLIGETFMKTPQPGDALKGFIQGIEETEAQKSL